MKPCLGYLFLKDKISKIIEDKKIYHLVKKNLEELFSENNKLENEHQINLKKNKIVKIKQKQNILFQKIIKKREKMNCK